MFNIKGQGAIKRAAPTTCTLKGQGATEYLVLLAVVLMIALVSIALLGFFPGLAGDAKATQSASYWKSARPFGIVDYSQTSATAITLMIQNNDPDQRTITNVTGGGNSTGSNGSVSLVFNAGEKKQFTLSGVSTACATGSAFEYYLNITYNTVDLSGLKQLGTKPIVGKCAT